MFFLGFILASELSGVDSHFLWQAVALLLVALVIAERVLSVFNVFGMFKPQRREVTINDGVATQQDLKAVDAKVAAVKSDVDKLRSDIVSNGETRRIAIEGKVQNVEEKVEDARTEAREMGNELKSDIAALGNGLAEMKGETKMIMQSIARIEMRTKS